MKMQKAHCAVLRIKDCLSYRLGQALIDYDKNGGGLCLLIKKLYHIKKTHQRTQRLYKDFISLYPHLKYPALEQCSDYEEALKCKYHLSYLLGQALIKAHKSWYKGGYLKLYTSIKDARKIYKEFKQFIQDHQGFKLNSSSLILIFENKEFINDEEYKNYLTFLLQHLNPKQKQEFIKLLFSLPNSHSLLKEFKELFEEFKDYEALLVVLKHNISFHLQSINNNLTLIKEWLHSKEFKEKYLDTKHPYPSLLNPLKLDYESVDAALAWDMNVPLPERYAFLVFALHTSGEEAFRTFLTECKLSICSVFGQAHNRYITCYKWLLHKDEMVKIIIMLDSSCPEFEKLMFLMREKPCVILSRDPIDRLKSFINIRHLNDGWHNKIFHIDFNQRNFDELNNRIVYVHSEGYFRPQLKLKEPEIDNNIKALSNMNHSMLDYILKLSPVTECFEDSKINYIDMNEIIGDKIYLTLQKLEKIGNFTIDNAQISGKQLYSNVTILLPVCIHINEMEFYISNYHSTKILPSQKDTIDFTSEFDLAKDKVFDSNLCIFIKKQDFAKFKNNENYYEIKNYISNFLQSLKNRILKENEQMCNTEQVLRVFKNNKETRLKFKQILDKELAHIKTHRPDIVASWSYYNEFEKMCEELDKH